jgi:hypothetical protein
MKGMRLYAVAALLGALLLMSLLLFPLPIGTTPQAACRIAMARAEGYGPWRYLGEGGVMAGGAEVILAYSDGINTSQCFVHALGPLWFVEPIVSETAKGCSLGVNQGQCPRARYGVVP